MFDHTPDPALSAFSRGLAELAPDPGGLDRDRLLFRAGAVLPTRRLRLWQAVAGLLAVSALSLGAALLLRPTRMVDRVVYVSVPLFLPIPTEETTPAETPIRSPGRAEPQPLPGPLARAETEGWRLRQQVLQFGVEALPPPPAWSGPEPAPMPLEKLLGLPGDSLDRHSTLHFPNRSHTGEGKR
jgi:hypothetical protein